MEGSREAQALVDLEIFQEAAFHTALALQNINLQMEHLEKKRMDKELDR